MRKVLDKDLEKAFASIIESENSAAEAIVAFLKETQDAGGLKVCQNVSKDDAAYGGKVTWARHKNRPN